MTDRDAGYREGIEAAAHRKAIAAAIYEVSNKWIAGNFPKGWQPRPFDELDEKEQRLHFAYADAIRALPLPSTPDDGKAEPVGYVRPHFKNQISKVGLTTIYAEKHKLSGDVPVYTHPSPAGDGAIRPAALEALRSYEQADADGVMVLVSRQALDEAINALSAHAGDAAKESGGGGNPAKTEPTEVAPGRGSMPPVSREHMLSSASAPPDTHAEVKG